MSPNTSRKLEESALNFSFSDGSESDDDEDDEENKMENNKSVILRNSKEEGKEKKESEGDEIKKGEDEDEGSVNISDLNRELYMEPELEKKSPKQKKSDEIEVATEKLYEMYSKKYLEDTVDGLVDTASLSFFVCEQVRNKLVNDEINSRLRQICMVSIEEEKAARAKLEKELKKEIRSKLEEEFVDEICANYIGSMMKEFCERVILDMKNERVVTVYNDILDEITKKTTDKVMLDIAFEDMLNVKPLIKKAEVRTEFNVPLPSIAELNVTLKRPRDSTTSDLTRFIPNKKIKTQLFDNELKNQAIKDAEMETCMLLF